MIISILNQKGGTGKSTIACNLAVAFKLAGMNAALVDADKQGTAAQFRAFRKVNKDVVQMPMFQILTDTIDDDVPRLAFSPIVIDVGGHDSKVFRGSMVCSDIVIVPIQPSGADLWSTEATLGILQDVRKFHKGLKVYGLLNMINPVAKAAREMDEMIGGFEADYKIRFFRTRLIARVQYQYTLTSGLSILEQNVDHKAKQEFEAFYREVCDVAESK